MNILTLLERYVDHVFFSLLSCFYTHGISNDVAGTVRQSASLTYTTLPPFKFITRLIKNNNKK